MDDLQNNLYKLSKLSETKEIDLYLTKLVKDILDIQLKNNKNKKKYLLISSVGNNSVHKECKWNYINKGYDILYIYYQDFSNKESEYYLRMRGKKLSQYYYIFQHNILNYYDYIFILDNDNFIKGTSINELFILANKLKCNILGPSIRIRDINHKEVLKLLIYYNNMEKKNKNFWFIKDKLPNRLLEIYNHVIKYSYWPHMIQRYDIKKKYIRQTNLVEDGRSIINTKLIKEFRKDLQFMKLFKSGIMFDQILANLCNFKKIYIVDYIYYIHLDPYKDKENEHNEQNVIKKYIKKNNINFINVYPDLIIDKKFILE
jgi:hypothetical protein